MKKIWFKTIKGKNFKQIDKPKTGAWIYYDHINEKVLDEVSRLAKIDQTDLKDSLDIYELPRIEREGNVTILFVRVPDKSDKHLHTSLLTIVITPNYFITLSRRRLQILEEIFQTPLGLATTQSSKLVLYILLKIIQLYTNRVRWIRNEVVKQQKQIEEVDSHDIQELVNYEEVLNEFLLALVPTKNIIEAIISGKYLTLYREDLDLLEDLLISVKQSVDICHVSLKSIMTLRDSYQIIFTNRLNKTMQFLTVFTILLTVPTIIGSIYGMNVTLPWAREGWIFNGLMVINAILMVILFIFFKLKRWV